MVRNPEDQDLDLHPEDEESEDLEDVDLEDEDEESDDDDDDELDSDEEEKSKKKKRKKRTTRKVQVDPICYSKQTRPIDPNLPKNYYFDNNYVEKLLTEYVMGGCTDVSLRDEIMSNAEELIKQIIRTHKLHLITNGKEGTAFGDLYQLAWVQIESSLYKFDFRPGHTKVFNMWCVSPDTMLITKNGIKTIGEMLYSGKGINEKVYGLNGFNGLSATLCRPVTDTLKIKTRLGYQVESTPEHRFYVMGSSGPKWVEAGNLKLGDLLGIQFNQQAFADFDDLSWIRLTNKGKWNNPKEINKELAYIFGLFIAEGSWSHNKLVIYNIDQDVIDKLVNNSLGLNFIHEPKFQRISLCNVRFIEFLELLGFKGENKSWNKIIPASLLKMSKDNLSWLLRGMFDGDGHSSEFNGEVGYTSTSYNLIRQLKTLLLNFGILSKTQVDAREYSVFRDYVSKKRICYQLILSTNDSKKFYDEIGFNIQRKSAKSAKLKPAKIEMFGINDAFVRLYGKYGPGKLGYDRIRPILKNKSQVVFLEQAKTRLLSWEVWKHDEDYQFINNRITERLGDDNNIAWLPIKEIVESTSPVCEITVDSSDHSYIANGFVSHNSQVAKTVMLAHIKKESRDKRNYGAYKEHLDGRKGPSRYKFDRFIEEARDVCKHHSGHNRILEALENLFETDNRPYDGLIDKLCKRSGMSRSKVSNFLRMLRLRSYEFTDSPLNEELPKGDSNKYRVMHHNYESDED